jgi:hypothetical protein
VQVATRFLRELRVHRLSHAVVVRLDHGAGLSARHARQAIVGEARERPRERNRFEPRRHRDGRHRRGDARHGDHGEHVSHVELEALDALPERVVQHCAARRRIHPGVACVAHELLHEHRVTARRPHQRVHLEPARRAPFGLDGLDQRADLVGR